VPHNADAEIRRVWHTMHLDPSAVYVDATTGQIKIADTGEVLETAATECSECGEPEDECDCFEEVKDMTVFTNEHAKAVVSAAPWHTHSTRTRTCCS
jgi:hypothetical protein